MDIENESPIKPAYVSYGTFSNFVAGLRESGIPNRIDKSVLPSLAGNVQSFLIQALKFLGLVTDEHIPTAALQELVESKEPEEQKASLAKVLRQSYVFLLNPAFNIAAATEAEIVEKFRDKDLNGDTIRKAISFFTQACAEAGIPLSPHLKSKRGKSSPVGVGRQRRSAKRKGETPAGNQAPEQDDGPKDHEKHTLYLDNTKQRQFIASAPLELTRAEYDRICKWLGVTLIVGEEVK